MTNSCNKLGVVDSKSIGTRDKLTKFVADSDCIGYKNCVFTNVQFSDNGDGIPLPTFDECTFVKCVFFKSGESGKLTLRNCALIDSSLSVLFGSDE